MTKLQQNSLGYPAKGTKQSDHPSPDVASRLEGASIASLVGEPQRLKLRHRLYGYIAVAIFRSSLIKRGPKLHHWTMKMLQNSANHNYLPALSLMGHLLVYKGETLTGKQIGLGYLERAAIRGDTKAQFSIAELYAQADSELACYHPTKAIEWYRVAAPKHPLASARLADIYANGKLGVSKDLEAASHWKQQTQQTIDVK